MSSGGMEYSSYASSSDSFNDESEETGEETGAWDASEGFEVCVDNWDLRSADEIILDGSMAYIHLGAGV